jgi:acetyl-CoA C-acetyltransferase
MSTEARVRTGIVGVGETPYRTRHKQNYVELAQDAAMSALAMAGMTPADVDAVVYSMAPTEFMGVTEADKWAATAVGARHKPMMRVHTGGATGASAAVIGHAHVASGLHDVVLVVGADKISETPDAQFILGLIWDPFFERGFGLNTVTQGAIEAVRHMDMYGTTEEQMAEVAVRSWRRAKANPNAHLSGDITVDQVMESQRLAWPLKRYDCCPRSSGGAAVVIASERTIRDRGLDAAWINGTGAAGNTVYIGDRLGPNKQTDFGELDELRIAIGKAYAEAGINDPVAQVDVAEAYSPFTIYEVQNVEALGFCERGAGGPDIAAGRFDVGGEVVVNPSGGTLCANPIAVTGLVRVCDAALQILGQAGDYQVPDAETAVATAIGGSAQFEACVVLSKEPV